MLGSGTANSGRLGNALLLPPHQACHLCNGTKHIKAEMMVEVLLGSIILNNRGTFHLLYFHYVMFIPSFIVDNHGFAFFFYLMLLPTLDKTADYELNK